MHRASAQGSTLFRILRAAEQRLRAIGAESPGLDARLLAAAGLGAKPDRLTLDGDRALDLGQIGRIEALMARRVEGREPVSRILGRREFWSLDFRITPEVLDPRPDSETLIEAALLAFPNRAARLAMLDLGTGSGCLLLAALNEYPNATGVGVDASAAAIAVAADNAARLDFGARARFLLGDWGKGLAECFDLILCNPPYIAESERAALPPEVARHDPPAALFAGSDGLDAYRAILPELPRLLAPDGSAVFEIGAIQAAAATEIARAAGLDLIGVRRDLAGHERCVVMKAKSP